MPDRRRRTPTPPPAEHPLIASARTITANQTPRSTANLYNYESWQNDAWDYWRSLGEYSYGVTWLSAAVSRVRLNAAEVMPGGDEPAPLDDGAAADLMEQFGGGQPGQAAVMKSFATQLSVPGECWLVAERPNTRIPLAMADWTVKSVDAIRPNRRAGGYEVRMDEAEWRPLASESLPVRIWQPDEQFPWRAWSPARPALPIMRRIDLLDRRIVATLVSRLAMNGILLIPQEGTFSVPAQYQDAADPFVQMLIDIASNNIRNPGNASAAIPIPLKFSSDLIDKWRHLPFGDAIDEQLLAEREKEIRRLATTLNMPAEVLTGVGEVNHWGQWAIEESAIKLHISPLVEVICQALTVGYLTPMLSAAGEEPVGPNGGKLVVWYDTSELTARPDKSDKARDAYDRLEISGAAYRREIGMDEADAPTTDEVRDQVLKRLATTVQLGITALSELTGQPPTQTPPPAVTSGPEAAGGGNTPANPPTTGESPADGPPNTRDDQPPTPGSDLPTAAGIVDRFVVDLPDFVPPDLVGVGVRAPPTSGRNGNGNGGRRSRDGPRGR